MAMLTWSPFVRGSFPVVFMFHSVGRADDAACGDADIPTHDYEMFAHFVRWLKSNAEVVPVQQLMREGTKRTAIAGRRSLAALTFDDGHLDNYTNVYPLLQSLGLPATFFIPTGLIGRRNGITSSMIRELSSSGFVIGSHSVTHPVLTSLSRTEVRQELRDSRTMIEDLTGLACRELAYPYGSFNQITMALAEEVGYEYALGASPYEPRDQRFGFPRTAIPDTPRHWEYRIALSDAQVWRRWLRDIRWMERLVHVTLGHNPERARVWTEGDR